MPFYANKNKKIQKRNYKNKKIRQKMDKHKTYSLGEDNQKN